MSDIASDLPKVKKVKVKTEKPKKEEKAKGKSKPKSEKPSKKEAKKEAKKEKKAKKSAVPAKEKNAKTAKPSKPSKAPKGKEATADSISAALVSGLTKKPEAGKVDYADAKSVEVGLISSTVSAFSKKYSDKAISAVDHENDLIKKGLKGILANAASGLRADLLTAKSKKISGLILAASKKASSGKLDAAGYKETVSKIADAI